MHELSAKLWFSSIHGVDIQGCRFGELGASIVSGRDCDRDARRPDRPFGSGCINQFRYGLSRALGPRFLNRQFMSMSKLAGQTTSRIIVLTLATSVSACAPATRVSHPDAGIMLCGTQLWAGAAVVSMIDAIAPGEMTVRYGPLVVRASDSCDHGASEVIIAPSAAGSVTTVARSASGEIVGFDVAEHASQFDIEIIRSGSENTVMHVDMSDAPSRS